MLKRLMLFSLLFWLIVAAYCWTRPGNSLCWVAEEHTLLQVQFSPYYFHRNRFLYSNIQAIRIVDLPDQANAQTIEVSTPRLNLVYGFANSDWIDDLPEFRTEIQQLADEKNGFSCRLQPATLWFIIAILGCIISAVALLVTVLRRR